MKKLIILLCLLSSMVKAQNQTSASLGISHQPSQIFEWENVFLEGSFYVGGDVFAGGLNARTNSDFKEAELSLMSKTKLFTPNEKINGELLIGTGFSLDQTNSDAVGEKHRNYFVVYGFQFSYDISSNWSLYWSLKKQHSGVNSPPIGGIGATVKIR